MKKWSVFLEQTIHSPEELEGIYRKLLPQISARCLILLEGPVGAGKTTSVQALARLYGFDSVASPSFAIHHRYENENKGMDHVDLYRLKDDEDLDSTGFWDLFQQRQALVLVEWADRLEAEVWPLHWQQIRVHLNLVNGNSQARQVRIEIAP